MLLDWVLMGQTQNSNGRIIWRSLGSGCSLELAFFFQNIREDIYTEGNLSGSLVLADGGRWLAVGDVFLVVDKLSSKVIHYLASNFILCFLVW